MVAFFSATSFASCLLAVSDEYIDPARGLKMCGIPIRTFISAHPLFLFSIFPLILAHFVLDHILGLRSSILSFCTLLISMINLIPICLFCV